MEPICNLKITLDTKVNCILVNRSCHNLFKKFELVEYIFSCDTKETCGDPRLDMFQKVVQTFGNNNGLRLIMGDLSNTMLNSPINVACKNCLGITLIHN